MHILASWPGIYVHADLPTFQTFKGGQTEKIKIEAAGTPSLLVIGDHLIEYLSSTNYNDVGKNRRSCSLSKLNSVFSVCVWLV